MKQLFKISLLFCAAIVSALSGFAQVDTQFWFAAPEMAEHSRDMSLRLYLTAYDEAAEVILSMPANAAFYLSRSTCRRTVSNKWCWRPTTRPSWLNGLRGITK